MIDVSQAPYNVVGDWNGSDATATNNTAALQAAIVAASADNTNGGIVDSGGTQGNTILLPKGSIMFDDTLTLGDGVSFQGSGDYATNLRVKGTFDPNKHRIRLGSPGDTYSSFGGRLRNLIVSQASTLESAGSTALVYTNDVQDGTLLDHVLLRGFQSRCFVGETGYGGASIIRLRQVTGNTGYAGRPAFSFDYGEGTMIDVEGLEPSGARVNPADPNSPSIPGTVGVYVRGGYSKFRFVHGELLETCMLLNLKTAKCFCSIDYLMGGPENKYEIIIQGQSPAIQTGRIELAHVTRNGSPPSNPLVLNGMSGASHIYNDILNPVLI
jgi:hypothetical protein